MARLSTIVPTPEEPDPAEAVAVAEAVMPDETIPSEESVLAPESEHEAE